MVLLLIFFISFFIAYVEYYYKNYLKKKYKLTKSEYIYSDLTIFSLDKIQNILYHVIHYIPFYKYITNKTIEKYSKLKIILYNFYKLLTQILKKRVLLSKF